MTVRDLPTPALLVDADVLERNIERMAGKVRRLGARLRPHVKTHKCIEIGRLQREHGAAGITVATLVEAREFAAAGFDDITWAFPLVPGRLDEVVELARKVTFRVLVDAAEAVDALEAASRRAGLRIHTWLEVDCGYHRSGVLPDRPASLALARRICDSQDLLFDGVLTHAGHSYHARTHAERLAIAREEREVTAGFAERLRGKGVAVPSVSVGSTPTMSATDSLAGADEARPGNYVFYDWMQAAVGVCRPEDVAVAVLASVVSHQPGSRHVIVDAGALAMSKDPGPAHSDLTRGFGPAYRCLSGAELEPRLALVAVSQELGFLGGPSPDDVRDLYRVGEKVRIMPNHSCLTAAQFDECWLVRGEEVVDRWQIRRGR